DVPVAEQGGEGVSAIGNSADRDVAAREVRVGDMIEISVSVPVVQGTVFAERLPVVTALHAVQHREPADVRAVKQLAVAVEIEAPRIPAALAEQLELVRQRVVAPHALLELDPTD